MLVVRLSVGLVWQGGFVHWRGKRFESVRVRVSTPPILGGRWRGCRSRLGALGLGWPAVLEGTEYFLLGLAPLLPY